MSTIYQVIVLLLLKCIVPSETIECGMTPIEPSINTNDNATRVLKIIGGNKAIPYSWPWQVYVVFVICCNMTTGEYYRYHQCGGSLINDQWILTAGHCAQVDISGVVDTRKSLINKMQRHGLRLSHIEVSLGVFNTTKFNRRYGVGYPKNPELIFNITLDNVFVHPSFTYLDYRGPIYDIALLKLPGPIDFTTVKHVRPVCLASGRTDQLIAHPGAHVALAGWGFKSQIPHKRSPNYLKQVRLTLGRWSECDPGPRGSRRIVCVRQNVTDSACPGDSGGPFVKKVGNRWYQFGLASTGYEICGDGPATATRTSFFCDKFIARTIGKDICI